MEKQKSQGKNVLITGGTSGLGYEMVSLMLTQGYNVVATGRQQGKLALPQQNLKFVSLDFSDLHQVSETFFNLLKSDTAFNLIINNAGIFSLPEMKVTSDGFEYTLQVNFLAHILIDEIIIRNDKCGNLKTVVSVTSPVYRYAEIPQVRTGNRSDYKPFREYASSKLSLALLMKYFSQKYSGKGIQYFSFNPGTFRSGIFRMQKSHFRSLYKVASPFMKKPGKVAASLLDIINEHHIVNGAIYRRRNKMDQLADFNDKIENEFWQNATKASDDTWINFYYQIIDSGTSILQHF